MHFSQILFYLFFQRLQVIFNNIPKHVFSYLGIAMHNVMTHTLFLIGSLIRMKKELKKELKCLLIFTGFVCS